MTNQKINNDFGQCDVDEWSDIVAVSAGCEFTIGLKSDGTVVLITLLPSVKLPHTIAINQK